ncbi:MAG: uracil-DNA glycosylase [Anaeroplasmataceae bacterium]
MLKTILNNEKNKLYFNTLMNKIKEEYKLNTCYPPIDKIFNAFNYNNVSVCILGQDPYFNEGEANGLSFSVDCIKLPPTLKNIYKEISSDFNKEVEQDGNLTYLSEQGVFLLNTVLTVQKGLPHSHKNIGWTEFTNNVLIELNKSTTPIVFILWGNHAISYEKFITNPIHLILTSSHPSPLGCYRSFNGSKPFSKTNEFLIKNKMNPIKWIKKEYLNEN